MISRSTIFSDIRCHYGEGSSPQAYADKLCEWEKKDDGFLHCPFCNSLHPDEVINVIHSGGSISRSEEREGWPEFIYVHTGPLKRLQDGEGAAETVHPNILHPSGATLKFHTSHLKEMTPVALDRLSRMIFWVLGLVLNIHRGAICWRFLETTQSAGDMQNSFHLLYPLIDYDKEFRTMMLNLNARHGKTQLH